MERSARVDSMLDRMRDAWIANGEGFEAERQAFVDLSRLFPEPQGVEQRPITVGGVPATESIPADGLPEYAPTLLYLHGGAFVIGSADIYREQSARLSRTSGARVITLDYRLAPEHPFPAAVDDTISAYLDLLETGASPERLIIGGDSAGGNLSLAAAMRLRDDGKPLPAGLVLLSPWVDLTCSGASMIENADARHLAQRPGLLASAETYLADQKADHPHASPLFGDLTGLPPALMQVGALETLLDESLELERRLTAAGTPVKLHVFEGMIHEWHLLSALLPPDEPLIEARQAIEEIAQFIQDVCDR